MAAIVTTNLRLRNANILKDIFTDAGSSLYLFVSKPTSWANESFPDAPSDSALFEQNVRDEMISLRKIAPTEITLSVVRRDWVSGKYYDQYRNDYNGIDLNGTDYDSGSAISRDGLINANYFVVTDDLNVYKCIWNNNRSASTVKPTDTGTSIFATADGYRWKYMYTINSSDALKFISTNFIPVQTIGSNPGASSPYYAQYLVENAAVSGKLDVMEIVSSGNGYAANTTLPIQIVGNGTGATATANTNGAGQITSINITSGGSGYTYATATVTGANTTPAVLNVIIPPFGGHGKDAVKELSGVYLTVSASIGDDLSEDTLKDNEYRVIGLLLNPKQYGTSTTLTSQTANALKIIQIGGGVTGNFTFDEDLNSSGTPINRGKFVSYNSSSKNLKYIRNKQNIGADFAIGQPVTGAVSSATGTITALVNPEVDADTGDLIYVETRRAIARSADQKEEMRITIET